MAPSYSRNHHATSCDDLSMAANPSLLAGIPVNKQFYLVVIKDTGFCILPLSKLQSALCTFLKDDAILTSLTISIRLMQCVVL